MSLSQDTADSVMVIDEGAHVGREQSSSPLVRPPAEQLAPGSDKKKRQRKDSAGDSILKDGASPIKKGKKKKDINAPHKPLNGYVLFLNQNRARILQQNPGVEFPDVTKKLAAEWAQLPEDKRQPYLQQAEQDRQRYRQELQDYKSSDAFRAFQQSLKSKNADVVVRKKPGPKPKPKTVMSTQNPAATATRVAAVTQQAANRSQESPTLDSWQMPSKSDIPIFTEDFLEHNKVRETELRQLRKLTTEYEEQNAILSKHIDKMKAAEVKLKSEMAQMAEKNVVVELTLNQLKNEVVAALANCPIPGTSVCPSLANIDDYMDQLYQRFTSSETNKENKENKNVQEKIRQVLRKFQKVASAADVRLEDKTVPPAVATQSSFVSI